MHQPLPGDPLPALAFDDGAGAPLDLRHPRLAGRLLLIARPASGGAAALAARVAANVPTLRALDGEAYLLLDAPPESALPLPVLIDTAGHWARAMAPGLLAVARDLRVIERFAPDEIERALACLAAEDAKSPPRPICGHAPVLLLDRVFEPALCADLMAHWAAQPKTENAVASRALGNAVAAREAKRRADVALTDPHFVDAIRARLARRVLPEIARAFRMEIVSSEVLRVGCYDAANGGAFARHRDNTTPATAHRRLAMSLNLNEGYQGGELIFPECGRARYRMATGGAVVFSCALAHEALPVIAGQRFGLFTFFNDRAGAEEERRRRGAPGR